MPLRRQSRVPQGPLERRPHAMPLRGRAGAHRSRAYPALLRRCVKAHMMLDEAHAGGWRLADWAGNARADVAANAAALPCGPRMRPVRGAAGIWLLCASSATCSAWWRRRSHKVPRPRATHARRSGAAWREARAPLGGFCLLRRLGLFGKQQRCEPRSPSLPFVISPSSSRVGGIVHTRCALEGTWRSQVCPGVRRRKRHLRLLPSWRPTPEDEAASALAPDSACVPASVLPLAPATPKERRTTPPQPQRRTPGLSRRAKMSLVCPAPGSARIAVCCATHSASKEATVIVCDNLFESVRPHACVRACMRAHLCVYVGV